MAEYFDSSPRASKRRRTATPKRLSTALEKENNTPDNATSSEDSQELVQQSREFKDSAYGPEEDRSRYSQPLAVPVANVMREMEIDNGSEGNYTTGNFKQPNGLRKRSDTTPPPGDADLDDDAEDTITVQPRSSGRERRKPRRYSLSPEQPRKRKPTGMREVDRETAFTASATKKQNLADQGTPKGILTPSRKEKRTGPRKSVNFDRNEKDVEDRLGFRDIQNSASKKSTSSERDAAPPGVSKVNVTPSKKTALKLPSTPTLESEPASEPEDEEIVIEDMFEEAILAIPEVQDSITAADWRIEDDPVILQIKSEVLARLTSREGTNGQASSHLQSQYDTLHALLYATVTSGESNSLLLLGARGTGKTYLLQTAIADLEKQYADDFHVVRLNGFCQTDDKVALREIWRQLGREMQVDEMETGETGGSYADTMSSLLSLLSHPDEFGDPAATESDVMIIDERPLRTSKSIVFIIDEFDLFTTHPRQTLLYNLFDIAQSKKAPIAVIGCSTCMDVVDCLEKRVKSRFSHRWLHIPSVKTLGGFEDVMKNILCVKEHAGVAAMKVSKNDIEARKRWNDYIQSTFFTSTSVQTLVKSSFYTTKSIPDLSAALFLPVACVQLPVSNSTNGTVKSTDDTACASNSPSVLELLSRLPTLQLSLLIAAARLDTIHNLTTLNFNLVFAHYVELISRSKLQITAAGAVAVGASLRQWSRDTARCAWEDLGSHECVVPVSGAAGVGAGSKDASSVGSDNIGGEGANVRMWRVDVTLEELEWSVKEKWHESGGVRDVLLKWCREI